MNVQTAIGRPEPVKLKVDDFHLLRNSLRFDAYSKAELFEGELLGVVRHHHDEPESDALVRINLTVEDYAALNNANAFAEYGRTELIDGVVYELSPQHRPHGFVKDELAYRVRRALEQMGSSWQVAAEQSVSLPPNNEPQPDVIVTTDRRGTGPIPGASVGLLVEISASTVNFDLNDKLRVYAAANIPEYWVLDVGAGRLHQFWAPQADRYMQRSEAGLGDVIEAKTIPQLVIDTSKF